jgi:iron complex transport system substrate-binding protein
VTTVGGVSGVALIAALLAGCTGGEAADPSAGAATGSTPGTSQSAQPGEPIVITADDLPAIAALGTAGSQTPQRIVSLATGVGETLVALGVADRVVGRDETSQVPAEAEVVTRAHNVSAERVIALDPDLVLVDARTTPPEALEQIAATGARVVEVPEAWTLTDMAPRTRAVAEAVGVDPAAVIATLPDADSTPVPGAPRVAFLYLRGTSAIYLLGGSGSGADALISAAGGVDAGAEAGLDPFTPLTAEALIALDPDILLVMTGGLESVNGVDGLIALPGVAQTTAGKQRRIIAVDDDVLLSYGPRTGALVDLLRAAVTRSMASGA